MTEDEVEIVNEPDKMQIGTTNLIGVRTFILALVALIGYMFAGYFGLSGEFLSGTKELVMMAFVFFFAKTTMKNS